MKQEVEDRVRFVEWNAPGLCLYGPADDVPNVLWLFCRNHFFSAPQPPCLAPPPAQHNGQQPLVQMEKPSATMEEIVYCR